MAKAVNQYIERIQLHVRGNAALRDAIFELTGVQLRRGVDIEGGSSGPRIGRDHRAIEGEFFAVFRYAAHEITAYLETLELLRQHKCKRVLR